MKLLFNHVSGSILDVKPDKRNEVFNWGIDNAFPSLVKAVIGMSVTASACVDKVGKAIYGGSFGEVGNVIINAQNQSLNELLRVAAREYTEQSNLFIAVSFNLNYEVTSISVVPSTHVRLGKADDYGYSGKYVVYDNWDKLKGLKIVKNGFDLYDKYSPNVEILKGQIEKAGDIRKYNGQIWHIKKDTAYVYSLPQINPVLKEALLEGNSQEFRSRGASHGFLNTKLLILNPFTDEKARRDFIGTLNAARGSSNSGGVVAYETEQAHEDVSKQIFLDDLSSNYNDKLFEYSDKQAEKNICKAYMVPLMLVNPSDNSLFGNSGEFLKEAKKQLFESREEERDQLEEVFSSLMKRFVKPVQDLKIINPYAVEEVVQEEKTPEQKNADAQATLRGSIGGVTSLLAIQQSVAAGTTDKEAGIAMIVNIFGFEEDIAKEMLGNPKQENTVQNG